VDRVAVATYDPEPAAVSAARLFVRETLRSWEMPGSDELAADAELLTSELVTNAVIHAGTPLRVTCRADNSEVEVSVLDWQPARTITGCPDWAVPADQVMGRGLLLAAALSSLWGVTHGPAAKAVWFRLRPDGAAPADPAACTAAATVEGDGPGQARAMPLARPTRIDADLLLLSYRELLSHTVELARDAVAADAAYILMADEDGVLRMGAAVGLGAPHEHARLAEHPTGPRAGHSGTGTFLTVYDNNSLAESGADGTRAAPQLPQSFLTAPVLADGRLVGVLAAIATAPDRFTAKESARVQHVAEQAALPLERARLNEHDRARRRRISFLAEASELLAGTLDQEQAIALAAQLVVPRLAAWCAVLVADESGQLTPAYVWHTDEARNDALSCLLSRVPPPRACFPGNRLQWSLSAPSAQALGPDAAELANDPVWAFPMLARGRSLGVLALGRPNGLLGGPTDDLAEDLARRVALALDNARLYTGQLRASHALQRSLLPPQLPVIPGLDIAAGYQPAGEGNEVGGDFYDVFQVGPDRWRFTIGDVCGKGIEAASVTGLTRHALHILAREGHDIPAVLERLNSIILEEGSAVPFLTLIHGEIVVMPGQAAISLVCAGHPVPLLLRSRGGTQAAGAPQPLIGVMDATFRADSFRLRRGDVLLCVTDGVTERRAGNRLLDDGNGLQKLLRDCSGLNAGAAVARIQQEVVGYGSDPPADDLALLVFRGT
jgi:serine phosphatase RsbU (regulator of sigma subunit)/anti-sigma regulatory factor (Ser/Thr protein kinase)